MFFHINHGMARKKRKNNIIIYVYDEFAQRNATSDPNTLRLPEEIFESHRRLCYLLIREKSKLMILILIE